MVRATTTLAPARSNVACRSIAISGSSSTTRNRSPCSIADCIELPQAEQTRELDRVPAPRIFVRRTTQDHLRLTHQTRMDSYLEYQKHDILGLFCKPKRCRPLAKPTPQLTKNEFPMFLAKAQGDPGNSFRSLSASLAILLPRGS